MTKRTITLLALASTLVYAGTASAATQPTMSAHPTPLTTLTTRTMRLIITNDTGGPLPLATITTDDRSSWRQVPGDLADGEVGDYTEVVSGNHDLSAALQYQLPGRYAVMYFKGTNPFVGVNYNACGPVEDGSWVKDSPYTCTVREDKKDWNDTNFYVTFSRKSSATAADHRVAQ
jgi:hypothetical protein